MPHQLKLLLVRRLVLPRAVHFISTLIAPAKTSVAHAALCMLKRSHILRTHCSILKAAHNFPPKSLLDQRPPLSSRHLFFALLQPPFIATRLAQVIHVGCTFFCHSSPKLEELEAFFSLHVCRAPAWLADCTRDEAQLLHFFLVFRLHFLLQVTRQRLR